MDIINDKHYIDDITQNIDSNKKEKEFTYAQIIEVINKIYNDERLIKTINISGGIVPWLISSTDSNRLHGDLDLIVKKADMPLIRQILEEYELYYRQLDSLHMKKAANIDYGIITFINDIPVGIFPYELTDDGSIIQRTFGPASIGYPYLKTRIIPNIAEEDYVKIYKTKDGKNLSTSSVEIIKFQKENERKSAKDNHDLAQIEILGYDKQRYERVKSSLSNMQIKTESGL